MKHFFVALAVMAVMAGIAPPLPAQAQVSIGIGIGLPGVSIGIHFPVYPRLVRVPGYPVYYASGLEANYFFFDGFYWLYVDDYWYMSSWYDGPWSLVQPYAVPYYILRVPVRYYRAPPPYFRPWPRNAPPRWGEYWGPNWEREHPDWSRWNPRTAPPPAPLPDYQRSYSGNRYPQPDVQPHIRSQNYRYEPKDPVVRQHAIEPFRAAPPSPERDKRPDVRREPEQRQRDERDMRDARPPTGRTEPIIRPQPQPQPQPPQQQREQQQPRQQPQPPRREVPMPPNAGPREQVRPDEPKPPNKAQPKPIPQKQEREKQAPGQDDKWRQDRGRP